MPLPPSEALQREFLSIIVLGATGDLATKKLFPALRDLGAGHFLPRCTRILATGRTPFANDASFREHLRETFDIRRRRSIDPATRALEASGSVISFSTLTSGGCDRKALHILRLCAAIC